jgi:hypothetical protein
MTTLWTDSAPPPRVAVSWVERSSQPGEPASEGDLVSAADDQYQLILGQHGSVDLYDYRRDPDETVNAAVDRAYDGIAQGLRRFLRSATRSWKNASP